MYKFEHCVYIVVIKDSRGNMGYYHFINTKDELRKLEEILDIIEESIDYELLGWIKIDLQTLDVDIKRNNDIIDEKGGD